MRRKGQQGCGLAVCVEVYVYLDVRRGQPGDRNIVIVSRITAHYVLVAFRKLPYEEGWHEGVWLLTVNIHGYHSHQQDCGNNTGP